MNYLQFYARKVRLDGRIDRFCFTGQVDSLRTRSYVGLNADFEKNILSDEEVHMKIIITREMQILKPCLLSHDRHTKV